MIPLSSLFHDDFCDHIETMGSVDFLSEKLLNIVELVKWIDVEWEYSPREQKVYYRKSFNKSVGSLVFNRDFDGDDSCWSGSSWPHHPLW